MRSVRGRVLIVASLASRLRTCTRPFVAACSTPSAKPSRRCCIGSAHQRKEHRWPVPSEPTLSASAASASAPHACSLLEPRRSVRKEVRGRHARGTSVGFAPRWDTVPRARASAQRAVRRVGGMRDATSARRCRLAAPMRARPRRRLHQATPQRLGRGHVSKPPCSQASCPTRARRCVLR